MTGRSKIKPQTVGLLGFTVLVAVVLIWLLGRAGVSSPTRSSYQLQAVVPNVEGLSDHADVRVGGVKVGEVTASRLIGNNAIVGMSLDPSLGGVYSNGTVQVRYKTALGEGYIDLHPGGPPGHPLPNGAILPESRAEQTVQVDQVLSTFDPQTRRRLASLLDGLGGGLDSQGQHLNDLLGSASSLVADSAPVLALVSHQREQVATLVGDLPRVARALGERDTDLHVLARRALSLSRAIAKRDTYLSATIAQVQGAVMQAGATAHDLGQLSNQSTSVLANLTHALIDLHPAVINLAPAAAAARAAVAKLAKFEPRARPLLHALQSLAPPATSLIPTLDATIRQANPLLSYLIPYRQDLTGFLSNGAAATQSTDETGHLARLSILFNQEAFGRLLSPAELQILKQLEKAGILAPFDGPIEKNAYPAPGTAGKPSRFSGSYPRIQALTPLFPREP